MNLHDASGAPCFGIATNIRDGSLSAVDAAIVNWVSETDYLADRNARAIALSISLAYDKAMRLRLRPTSIPKGWFGLVLLTLVLAVLIYVIFHLGILVRAFLSAI